MTTEVKRSGGSELGQRAEDLVCHIRNTGIIGFTKKTCARKVFQISEQLLWNQKAVDRLGTVYKVDQQKGQQVQQWPQKINDEN